MAGKTPLLTVVVPTYNGHRFLRRAVESLLAEPLPAQEVLVVDDGSTDDTPDTIRDLPVVILRKKHGGIASAYNAALARARGEYVAFLDHDDLAVPGGLGRCVAWLEARPEASAVRGEVLDVIDESDRALGSFETIFHRLPSLPESIGFEDLAGARMGGGAFLCALWLHVFRRSALVGTGPFDESLKVAHDVDFLVRFLKRRRISLLPVPLARYRLHGGNTSGRLVDGRFAAHPATVAESVLVGLSHGLTPF